MTRRLLTALGTLWLAALAVDHGLRHEDPELAADGSAFLQDSDGDFLPDLLEWPVLGNSTRVDTDGDGSEDFVEAVQSGLPWKADPPAPADHEMRIVITSHVDAAGVSQIWMHTLLRLMGRESVVQTYRPWVQFEMVPGLRLPLDLSGWGEMQIDKRDAGAQGLWYRISFHLASAEAIRPFLPLTIAANATLDGREVHSGAHLFPSMSGIGTLVPADGGFVSQVLDSPPEGMGGSSGISNKYCLMELTDMGGGAGGRVYEVDSAECEVANDLECSLECPDRAGTVFIIPDGVGIITGG